MSALIWSKYMSKSVLGAALDNRSNQLTPQHPLYYLSRGLD